jgi:transcription elongation GreA/GreB family factor
MRTAIRRSNKIPKRRRAYKITEKKFQELSKELEKLKNDIRPIESKEVKILSTTGDYSENAGYQEAKHKLRRTNNKISKIEEIISNSEIIKESSKKDLVEIGSIVSLETESGVKKYQILGSLETNPEKETISYSSPLGRNLLNKKVGDVVVLNINNTEKKYKIIKVN